MTSETSLGHSASQALVQVIVKVVQSHMCRCLEAAPPTRPDETPSLRVQECVSMGKGFHVESLS